jgi:hypothetical protein
MPEKPTVEVWSVDRPQTTLDADDTLVGEEALAGFTVAVADLFGS